MQMDNKTGYQLHIVFKLNGAEKVKMLNEFIEKRIVPLQKEYPHAEISIEVSV